MATYATLQDFQNYPTEFANQDAGAINAALDRAERDIDRILPKPYGLTNSIQGISVSGATGGSFSLSLLWQGANYITPPIAPTADGPTLLSLLQAMVDQYGNGFLSPGSLWLPPETRYYSQPWAFGPLPDRPVVVEAYNQLSSQRLSLLAPDITNLIGPQPAVAVTEIVRGGLRINPYQISLQDSQKLRDATCAQAEYRLEMGEQFFRRPQWQSVSGPEFKTQGKLPMIGPKTKAELSGSDLYQRGARAVVGKATSRTVAYAHAGTTPLPDDWIM